MTDPNLSGIKNDPDFTVCANWGQGGRYVFDPATQQRTPVIDPDAVVTEERIGAATGVVLTAVEGSMLTPDSGTATALTGDAGATTDSAADAAPSKGKKNG